MKTTRDSAEDRNDAYLDWGLATEFQFFFQSQRDSSDEKSIDLLIEWNSLDAAARGLAIAEAQKLSVPGIYSGGRGAKLQRIWALSVPVASVVDFISAATPFALQFELAAPIGGSGDKLSELESRLRSDQEILAAVMDDGCAFANVRFMLGNRTRVLWLWNQDPSAAGFPLDSVSGPSVDCNFAYGGQLSQNDLNLLIAQENGSQDPVYARAGLPGLRHAAAHGPHVTDLLCGAENWQIVFVQFPLAAIDDPSGRWLSRYALDGLHYIIECAGPPTKKIVVNLSWGPQTGPHDGSSVLERAIDDLVNAQPVGRELIVTLPAGNSFGSQAHAEIEYNQGGLVHWIVPPDGHTPAFLEIWWPQGVAPAKAKLRITPPQGAAVDVIAGMPWPIKTWYARLRKVGASTKALVVVHPTEYPDPKFRGRDGQWTIEIARGQPSVQGNIHLYVARADHNMGARRRAKASFLTDAALETGRFVAPDRRYKDVAGSAIRREGTLNGIATGANSKVAAGYRFSDFEVAPYSSSGPSRGTRIGPDFACVTDLSAARQGIRASGVRSGTKVRLVGTSMASPQLGRILAHNLIVPVPVPNPPDAPVRIGASRIRPDAGVIDEG